MAIIQSHSDLFVAMPTKCNVYRKGTRVYDNNGGSWKCAVANDVIGSHAAMVAAPRIPSMQIVPKIKTELWDWSLC